MSAQIPYQREEKVRNQEKVSKRFLTNQRSWHKVKEPQRPQKVENSKDLLDLDLL